MHYQYNTTGTCSKSIEFDIDESGVVSNVVFFGGCNGNLKGISALIEGKNAKDIIPIIKNIKCGLKNTSCPDQLSIALSQAVEKI